MYKDDFNNDMDVVDIGENLLDSHVYDETIILCNYMEFMPPMLIVIRFLSV